MAIRIANDYYSAWGSYSDMGAPRLYYSTSKLIITYMCSYLPLKRLLTRDCICSKELVWRRRPFYAPPENKKVWSALYSALVQMECK